MATPQITFRIRGSSAPASQLTFDEPVIKIGRVPSAHLKIDDQSVSRMHAIIEAPATNQISVIDLGSVTGTFVNGQRINKAKLVSGDVLRIGAFDIDVTITDIPLIPEIQFQDASEWSVKACHCCGQAHRVRVIRFGWREQRSVGVNQTGGTVVAICRGCRKVLRALLDESDETT